MKNLIELLPRSVLIPLILIAAADVGIHKKIISLWTILIISNKEMKYTIKIVKSLE